MADYNANRCSIGLAGQFVSDLVTSALEGELSFSHCSAYVGAAVGGAAGYSLNGMFASIKSSWPDQHTWKSPNVERWYPFR